MIMGTPSLLYLFTLIITSMHFTVNATSGKCQVSRNVMYRKQLNRITTKRYYLCKIFKDSFPCFFGISGYDQNGSSGDLLKRTAIQWNQLKIENEIFHRGKPSDEVQVESPVQKRNVAHDDQRIDNLKGATKRFIQDGHHYSLNAKNPRGGSSGSWTYPPTEKGPNVFFINYTNLKQLRKYGLRKGDPFITRKSTFLHTYEGNRLGNYSTSATVGEKLFTVKNEDTQTGKEAQFITRAKKSDDAKDPPNLDAIFDQINSYLDIEKYKDSYGEEVYNQIVKLYVHRHVPENYEQLFFMEQPQKSVALDVDKYDEDQFQKLIEEEFQRNGVHIENINKEYYKRENIKKTLKVLNYLPLLNLINNPNDLKKLKKEYLPLLAHELKMFLFFMVNLSGGHFSAGLSLLEVQLMLMYLFDQPHDDVIYDIGHQTYVHKILTGRKFIFLSLRQKEGLCGFLNTFESTYDKFGAGHSSTALSAIQGFYEADWQVCQNRRNTKSEGKEAHPFEDTENITFIQPGGEDQIHAGENLHASHPKGGGNPTQQSSYPGRNNLADHLNKVHIAIIGDGGLTGGMALEALNYISFLNSKVLIIYNDNGQVSLPTNAPSISGHRPIGSISDHLRSFITRKSGKGDSQNSSDKEKNNFFENLNYDYVQVQNGNNTEALFNVLSSFKKGSMNRATVLHVCTNKTSEFINSRAPITVMHSIKKNEIFPFNVDMLSSDGQKVKSPEPTAHSQDDKMYSGKSPPTTPQQQWMFSKKTFTDVYTEEMLKYLERDKNIIFISPAMLGGSGLVKISDKYPNNVYDVGIAEQHATTFATAMAMNKNLKVHLCIYSTFMQRAYDQIIHDLNLQKVPLKVIIGRSGLVGEDGATHQGIYDLTILGALNNACVISPSNQVDLKKALKFCYHDVKRSVFVRLPRINTFTEEYLQRYFRIGEQLQGDGNVGHNRQIDWEKANKGGDPRNDDMQSFFGKARVIKMSPEKNEPREGRKKKVSIFNMGSMLFNVLNAIEEIEKDQFFSNKFSFSIIDMIFLNPMDKKIIDYLIEENKHDVHITYEDNTVGGFSTHFNNYLIEKNYISRHQLSVHNIYVPNDPIEHSTYVQQYTDVKMDSNSLVKRIKSFLQGQLSN
ncbi:1-deoxy-D-xylulose 5-phosphate synthase, putative [Plasmodium knowlesi strain H]|uniref:1-deoxy-D-xylulose-5-phosphate synthase n=3 Tax=Plasmodium knowlesi TaxID=5850 RepID=A0A5K1V4H9_PLAKH|nr:1-deoxy-D-xylulose 5-phosphate synthase, putative [Plasmodium knowlesi strain H]OTN66224.1 putative 1-deoxy-D-xylulose 5-phosphate synthase [Plasmodium knowlesi]CAA9989960.1 1-deoxy-D-xylulose 5-phosphate synthase, putative [Plasmodium knowlesi strain H]SBO24542.1 1-deoxy-D-xylulose 5-phosphate synthase, putative [Plasmodium knowlesi strain H]SBO26377.1 1-deoxy-D-xylulose 5-phosphate synthase, putative [Plasmodium knowlesi strain H]VVS79434.1 1-deoxy-D-xylulose 5-phosphate synthase, putativ|eukprot:XP_002259975.1 1-deoxy-D-xylulose 5-phosphate synthase,putative [Plasmodium knowlesi strain H]